jgi:Cu(I)/Ag(I) efflux system membrane protein CusA/SilA
MLQRIIDFSLKNKFLVLLATLALVLGGIYAVRNIPLDAIPDLSDTQVIIYTEWNGQAPNIIEDQVTYPITTKMLSVPKAKVVRGYSFYGFSFVYVIFEDGTDPYWARSRVLEYLSSIGNQLPKGVAPSLGPDATGVGWAFMYSINSTNRDLAELRSMQDWYLKYQLTAVPGVSEVASVGGFVKQYQVRRSDKIARLQPRAQGRQHGHRAQQRRSRRALARIVRARIYFARQGLHHQPQ